MFAFYNYTEWLRMIRNLQSTIIVTMTSLSHQSYSNTFSGAVHSIRVFSGYLLESHLSF